MAFEDYSGYITPSARDLRWKWVLYYRFRQLPWPWKMVLFLHMPKAAGISLNLVLQRQYGNHRVWLLDASQPVKAYREVITASWMRLLSHRAISGHVLWGVHEWLPLPYVYITVLRHPVERVLSYYSYVLASPTHRLHQEATARNMSLEDFLEWEASVVELSNLQCRLLASVHPYQEKDMVKVYRKARRHLEDYCIVGLTERLQESLDIFREALRWRKSVTLPRANVTPNRLRRVDVAPRTLRRIEALNEWDLALYEDARQLFAQQQEDILEVLKGKRMR